MKTSKRLRIGVEIWPLVKLHGGISYYIFHLLDELIKQNPDWEFFLYAPARSKTVECFQRHQNVHLHILSLFTFKYIFWRNSILPYSLRKDKIDVFWENVFVIPFLKPRKMKTVLTVYDFVAYLFPETLSLLSVFYHRLITSSTVKKADYIVSISKGTAKRLNEMFGRVADEVVIPPSKPEVFYREKEFLSPFLTQQGLKYNDYLVSVSTWEPRKNFVLLIQLYCKTLEEKGLENVMPLVIIGGGGWKNKRILKAFQSAQKKYPTHFKIAGYASDHELSLFLSGARYYISLSLYEGYGMPLAEARHCRTPVICLDIPEMREAAENDGIFLKKENLETDLPKLMLRGVENENEKPSLELHYPSNAEGALRMASILKSLC